MKIIESASDPRSEYFQVMRRENIPADELMGRRMEIGVIAVLAQLGAKRNWHRIMREWVYADEPETELGRQEWEYFEARGVRSGARDRARPRPVRVPARCRRSARGSTGSGAVAVRVDAPDRDDQADHARSRRRPAG